MSNGECWVVKSGKQYFWFLGHGRVYYTDDIMKANRYEDVKMAKFMSGRLGGEIVKCRVINDKVVEQPGTANTTPGS